LNLKCDILVSKFGFKFNLYRYTVAVATVDAPRAAAGKAAGAGASWQPRAPTAPAAAS
jgi:hypothetical protein